jgi:hypothetical protein
MTHMTHFPIEALMRARTILLYWEMGHGASCVMVAIGKFPAREIRVRERIGANASTRPVLWVRAVPLLSRQRFFRPGSG